MDAKNKFLSKEGLVRYHEKIQEQLSKKFPIKGELNSYHRDNGYFEDDALTNVSDIGVYFGDTYTLLVTGTDSMYANGGVVINQLKFTYEEVGQDAVLQPLLYHRVYTNGTWSDWERVNIEKGTYLEGSTTDSGEFFASENAIDLQAGGAVTQLRLDGTNATLSHMDSSTTLTVGNDDISMTAGNNSAVFGLGGGDGIELRYNNNSIAMDPQMGIKISADQDGLAL